MTPSGERRRRRDARRGRPPASTAPACQVQGFAHHPTTWGVAVERLVVASPGVSEPGVDAAGCVPVSEAQGDHPPRDSELTSGNSANVPCTGPPSAAMRSVAQGWRTIQSTISRHWIVGGPFAHAGGSPRVHRPLATNVSDDALRRCAGTPRASQQPAQLRRYWRV